MLVCPCDLMSQSLIDRLGSYMIGSTFLKLTYTWDEICPPRRVRTPTQYILSTWKPWKFKHSCWYSKYITIHGWYGMFLLNKKNLWGTWCSRRTSPNPFSARIAHHSEALGILLRILRNESAASTWHFGKKWTTERKWWISHLGFDPRLR